MALSMEKINSSNVFSFTSAMADCTNWIWMNLFFPSPELPHPWKVSCQVQLPHMPLPVAISPCHTCYLELHNQTL